MQYSILFGYFESLGNKKQIPKVPLSYTTSQSAIFYHALFR